MVETTFTEQTTPTGVLLLDYYERLFVAEHDIAEAEDIMGSSSPINRLGEVAQELGLRDRRHSRLLSVDALAAIGRDALDDYFAYSEAEQKLKAGQAKRDTTVELINDLSAKVAAKKVVARASEDYPNAILWYRDPLGDSVLFSKVEPQPYAKGVYMKSQLPISTVGGEAELELSPTGFRSVLGVYSIYLLDGQGHRMVDLEVED